jgi:hypothetical protein
MLIRRVRRAPILNCTGPKLEQVEPLKMLSATFTAVLLFWLVIPMIVAADPGPAPEFTRERCV